MSDIEETIIDTYTEHPLHEFWDKKCSVCYADKQRVLNSHVKGVKLEKSVNTDLMSERSAHPEESYW